MSAPIPAAVIETDARGLTSARPTPLGVEVTTPVVYPDGDCVVVLVATEVNGYVVHDAGLGAMRLSREGISLNRDMRERLSAAGERYGCQFQADRMTRRCEADDVPASIMLVANASRSAGDMAAEARRQVENSFRYVLTERVREIVGPRLRENEFFRGQSKTVYRVANTILDEAGREPVAFIVPLASRSAVAGQFRELYDLRGALPNVYRESVYDEGSDFRPEEDGWMLNQVGEVVPFGQIAAALPRLLSRPAPQQSLPS